MTANKDYTIGHNAAVIEGRIRRHAAAVEVNRADENLVLAFMREPRNHVPADVRQAYERIAARAIGAEGKR